ncbi:MAG: Rne/Rng family ribonuclease, partial [Hyphomicrobiales bacterium]|nr:Rne/Rng family ribonuclease [Hyphomicrobiales bacterium]
MPNKMLIDASQPEETRVVVLRGNKVEEFDFESAARRPLRGNIYLAKVTRVEPALQAAFVEYGGNRHGFLAFSEIHPDYYQIPVADRQALLEEDAREAARAAAEDAEPRHSRRHNHQSAEARRVDPEDNAISEIIAEDVVEPPVTETAPQDGTAGEHLVEHLDDTFREVVQPEAHEEEAHEEEAHDEEALAAAPEAQQAGQDETGEDGNFDDSTGEDDVQGDVTGADENGEVQTQSGDRGPRMRRNRRRGRFQRGPRARGPVPGDVAQGEDREAEAVDQMGGDAMEEVPQRQNRLRRQYKIQEVIKRRQVLLVQVVKEERGNKGAAVTTYLSLAGRYCVLMPNTARGGGISRKITDSEDRSRLKAIAQELEVPEGMGVILRTAGAARTPVEVRRDFEYLLRLWETVRELTLKSSAPTLVYEEGSLIKRSIRDLYNSDIDEISVAGEAGYDEARDFMRMLMPSHVKNVRAYRDPQPIFAKAGVETQLDAMFSNQVTLKSGGYIVINQTEALVAIDVNSGRSTREHNIEDTAVRTNLEAADEVARQLRLRDLAGLIVVDFIDMDEHRNNRTVERRMKEALANDRARIQVGRISHFGLLEMSRQRMRTGVFEGSTVVCPHCSGAGSVRSTSSVVLHVLRLIEDALIRNSSFNLSVRTRSDVALYILNHKREHLRGIEQRFGIALTFISDDTLATGVYHVIERGEAVMRPADADAAARLRNDPVRPADRAALGEGGMADDEEAEDEAALASGEAGAQGPERAGDEETMRRRRRRRRRRGGAERPGQGGAALGDADQPSDDGMALM